MTKYYNIYMQKEKSGSPVADIPFKRIGDPKSLTERDWAGEDGKDVYVPEKLAISNYTMKIKLCCKGEKYSANEKIKKLHDYLIGNDGNGVYIKLYCDYTKEGRQHIRFSKIPDDATLVRNDDDGDILVFSVEVTVDDPVTEIKPVVDVKGNITKLA